MLTIVKPPVSELSIDRDSTIAAIRTALKRRSGKAWSVTGGRGTAWGWLAIDAPPARRTWDRRLKPGTEAFRSENWEGYDTGEPGHYISPADAAELASLLGLESVHHQGVKVPDGHDYYREYIDRAEGRTPAKLGVPYWD